MQLRLGFLSIFGMAMLLTPVSAIASDNAQPYKATTVDECIQEKECVWYAFSKQLRAASEATGVYKNDVFFKWKSPIKFSVRGQNAKHFLQDIVDASEQLGPFTPLSISVSSQSNFQIIYTNNFDETFSKIEQELDRQVGKTGLSRQWYERLKNVADGSVGFVISNDGGKTIGATLLLIDDKHPNAEYITAIEYYSAFGFGGYAKDQPFSLLSDKKSESLQFSLLDKFLLYLLYKPEFKSGSSLKEAKVVFDKLYEETKIEFYNIINKQK